MDVGSAGRVLVVAGLVLVALALLAILLGRVPFLGRLPRDFVVRPGPGTLYARLAPSILPSLRVTLVLSLILRR